MLLVDQAPSDVTQPSPTSDRWVASGRPYVTSASTSRGASLANSASGATPRDPTGPARKSGFIFGQSLVSSGEDRRSDVRASSRGQFGAQAIEQYESPYGYRLASKILGFALAPAIDSSSVRAWLVTIAVPKAAATTSPFILEVVTFPATD